MFFYDKSAGSLHYSSSWIDYFVFTVQADEGPVKESGQPETHGAAGEEQKHPTDGGGQEERGQSERKLPADKGTVKAEKENLKIKNTAEVSFLFLGPTPNTASYHNNTWR